MLIIKLKLNAFKCERESEHNTERNAKALEEHLFLLIIRFRSCSLSCCYIFMTENFLSCSHRLLHVHLDILNSLLRKLQIKTLMELVV